MLNSCLKKRRLGLGKPRLPHALWHSTGLVQLWPEDRWSRCRGCTGSLVTADTVAHGLWCAWGGDAVREPEIVIVPSAITRARVPASVDSDFSNNMLTRIKVFEIDFEVSQLEVLNLSGSRLED
ncbi:hypothetical protein E2542_SST04728 [Spatholobus suberectus]|nr:hypothetical protein E2542_SST04728 [Spatholobus suberectus]